MTYKVTVNGYDAPLVLDVEADNSSIDREGRLYLTNNSKNVAVFNSNYWQSYRKEESATKELKGQDFGDHLRKVDC